MRWTAVALALGIAGALAFTWLMRGGRGDATTGAAPDREAAEEIAALRHEVAGLRAELRSQRAASWQRTPPAAGDQTPAPASPGPAPSDEERLAADRARSDETVSTVAARFAGEHRDVSWSGPAAAQIEQDLKRGGLTGLLRGVACATTMCQVSLALDDEDAREQLARRLVELPAFQTQVLYHHERDTQPPRVTVYVARAGHPLPLAAGR